MESYSVTIYKVTSRLMKMDHDNPSLFMMPNVRLRITDGGKDGRKTKKSKNEEDIID